MAWEEGMEPELRSQPPRLVHGLWKAKFVPGLFFTLGVGLAALFGCIGYFAQQTHDALRDHGQAITAKLVIKEPRRNKSGPYLIYEYVVDGQSHRHSASASSSDFDAAQMGQPLELVYLPESPGKTETAAEVKQGNWSTGALVSVVVGPILCVILFGAWFFVRRWQGQKLRLARDGLPTWTAAHEVLLGKSSPKYDQYKIRYEYVANGARHESTTTVTGAVMQALCLPDARAVVLYDPLDPAYSDLYPAITTLYRIEATR